MKKRIIAAKCRTQLALLRAKEGLMDKSSKLSGAQTLVIAIILVAIGVSLCVIFRNTIKKIMEESMSKMEAQITTLINEQVASGGSNP